MLDSFITTLNATSLSAQVWSASQPARVWTEQMMFMSSPTHSSRNLLSLSFSRDLLRDSNGTLGVSSPLPPEPCSLELGWGERHPALPAASAGIRQWRPWGWPGGWASSQGNPPPCGCHQHQPQRRPRPQPRPQPHSHLKACDALPPQSTGSQSPTALRME